MTFADFEKCVRQGWGAAVVEQCRESGCELRLEELPSHIVLKGERLVVDTKIADCLVFVAGDAVLMAVVELKSRTVRPSEVFEKMENGCKKAFEVWESCFGASVTRPRVLFLVLAKRWTSSATVVFGGRRISIEGQKHRVLTKRCGAKLKDFVE